LRKSRLGPFDFFSSLLFFLSSSFGDAGSPMVIVVLASSLCVLMLVFGWFGFRSMISRRRFPSIYSLERISLLVAVTTTEPNKFVLRVVEGL